MSARFADRVFIVSGAGSHTGRATAKRLAAEGARLVLVVGNRDRDPMSRPAATHNGTAALVTGDSAARATARDAVQTALTRFGRLDGVVTHDQATPEPATSAEALGLLDRMVHDSVRSTYLLAQEAAREMHSGGTVVCVTAPGGAQVEVGRVAHNVVAGAITELARSLAVALAPYDIRANAVNPGSISATDSHRVAAAVAFLLSDEASYVTGAVVPVDGGPPVVATDVVESGRMDSLDGRVVLASGGSSGIGLAVVY